MQAEPQPGEAGAQTDAGQLNRKKRGRTRMPFSSDLSCDDTAFGASIFSLGEKEGFLAPIMSFVCSGEAL